MKILFVTYGLPYPPHSGARLHDFNLIKNISQHHRVLLLSLLESPEEAEHLPQLKQYCDLVDFVVARSRSVWENITGVVHSFLTGSPIAIKPFFYDEMVFKLRNIISTWSVDIIQIEQSYLSPYVEVLPRDSTVQKILSFHNVGFRQYHTMLRLKISSKEKLLFGLKSLLMLHWEAKYAEKFDRCLVVSSLERQLLQSLKSRLLISVIENGFDTKSYPLLAEAANNRTLLFVGTMSYAPNIDAVLYFCHAILPTIEHQLPNVKLFVVGRHPTPEIHQLAAGKNIIVTDYVPDVMPYYEQSQVSVVPLRAGGGTRLKILESMALGRAVVSTSLGCEGLEVVDFEHIMIADTPSEFASKTIQLLTDKQLRERIACNARQLIQTHYDWSAISRKLMALYSKPLTKVNLSRKS